MLKLCTYNQSGLKFIPGLLIFYHILSKLIAKLNLSIIFYTCFTTLCFPTALMDFLRLSRFTVTLHFAGVNN